MLNFKNTREITLGTKKIAARAYSCTIRLTKQEKEKVIKHCRNNGLTMSEYFRFLARVHLNIDGNIKKVQKAKP